MCVLEVNLLEENNILISSRFSSLKFHGESTAVVYQAGGLLDVTLRAEVFYFTDLNAY